MTQQMQLDHVSINVRDARASLHFYGEVMGLARLPSVRMADHDLHYFALSDGARLELIAYDQPGSPAVHAPDAPGSYRHLAFRVERIQQWAEHLQAHGVRVCAEPAWIPALQSTNMLLMDCNGVEIELLERAQVAAQLVASR
jgi:glyoxylase I family protein